MARLSALSDNLQDQGDSPGDDDDGVPDQRDPSNKETNYELSTKKSDERSSPELRANEATMATTLPPDDDSLLTGDIAGKLKDLGLPDSWFGSPKEKKSGGETGDENPFDDLDGLSEEEIEDIIIDLLGLDSEGKNGGKTKSLLSKRNARFLDAMSGKSKDEQHLRSRRHAGLHDAGGIQRLISTGTLAPPLSPVLDDLPSNPNSIDVIFATYWFYPKPNRVSCLQIFTSTLYLCACILC